MPAPKGNKYAKGCETSGRPTKYTPELLETAWDYLKNHEENYSHQFPSIEGLAYVLKVSRSTLNKWMGEEDKKEFSDIAEAIAQLQIITLCNKGLAGEYNSTIAKLLLSKHGYHEKTELDANIRDELTDTERAARIASILDEGRTRRDRQTTH
jgi:hypothetical protein